jgi:hypothetical protein
VGVGRVPLNQGHDSPGRQDSPHSAAGAGRHGQDRGDHFHSRARRSAPKQPPVLIPRKDTTQRDTPRKTGYGRSRLTPRHGDHEAQWASSGNRFPSHCILNRSSFLVNRRGAITQPLRTHTHQQCAEQKAGIGRTRRIFTLTAVIH